MLNTVWIRNWSRNRNRNQNFSKVWTGTLLIFSTIIWSFDLYFDDLNFYMFFGIGLEMASVQLFNHQKVWKTVFYIHIQIKI